MSYNISSSTPLIITSDKVVTVSSDDWYYSPQFINPLLYPTTHVDSEHKYLPSINYSYTIPSVSIYENLNADPRIHKRVTKYFRLKMLDKWLYDDSSHLLGYFKVKGDKVELISKLSDYDANASDKDSDDINKKKIKYIENNLLSYDFSYKILQKLVEDTNTNWYDLHKHEGLVKDAFNIALKKLFKKQIM